MVELYEDLVSFCLGFGLEDSLKADGQRLLMPHMSHLGLSGVQIVCPKPTSNGFIGSHSSLGSHFSRDILVCSGVVVFCFVPSRKTHPRRLEMRCTWVSTQIPWVFFQAMLITKWAILGPTPLRASNSFKESGISPPKRSRQILEASFMNWAFLW